MTELVEEELFAKWEKAKWEKPIWEKAKWDIILSSMSKNAPKTNICSSPFYESIYIFYAELTLGNFHGKFPGNLKKSSKLIPGKKFCRRIFILTLLEPTKTI